MGGQSARVLSKGTKRGPRAAAIPFYRQSFDFTCGPACLLMAMRHFDPALEATREAEIDIWREANLVEAYASSRQGLALAAHRRGFRVRSQGNVETIELLDCLNLGLSKEGRGVARALHEDIKARSVRAGIRDRKHGVTLGDLARWLEAGWVPLVLVDARLVGDEAMPHWVVVRSYGDDAVILHDPLASKGGTRVDAETFARRLGFRGTSCAVIVEGRKVRSAKAIHERPRAIAAHPLHTRLDAKVPT